MEWATVLLFIVSAQQVAWALIPTQLQLKHMEVYTLEHLNQVSHSPSGGYIRDTLLVLYNATCRTEAHALPLLHSSLPSMPLLATLLYDWEQFPARVWYQQEDAERLEKRFPPRGCPSILFIPQGQGGAEDIRYWEEGRDGGLREWVSAMLERNVTLHNTCENDVKIVVTGNDDKSRSTLTLATGSTETRVLRKSDRIVALSAPSGKYIQGFVVIDEMQLTVRCTVTPEVTSLLYADCDDLVDVGYDLETQGYLNCARDVERVALPTIVNMASQVMYNLKNPLVVPIYTTYGYEKRPLPKALYANVHQFYISERHKRQVEDRRQTTSIKTPGQRTTLVDMSSAFVAVFGGQLKGTLEEWCGCELELMQGYGVREYYTGSVLYRHVDRMDTHVISAIVHVHKELGDNPDWPLEVIDLSGVRRQVYLEPGEMLLYESTKMIHGRPQPFRGHLYANAFFHYRPVGWQYRQSAVQPSREPTLMYGRRDIENLFPLETPLTDQLPTSGPEIETLLRNAGRQRGPMAGETKRTGRKDEL